MSFRLVGPLCALGLGLLGTHLSAPDDENEQLRRRTLAGVSSVYVLVDDVAADSTETVPSAGVLKNDAELRLRSVGIRVATKSEALALAGTPYLHVGVTGIRSTVEASGKRLGYAAAVELRFFQAVRLDRDPSIRIPAATWSVSLIVTGPSPEIIRPAVKDLADQFVNAYLSANPKR
jgi:hypothetical protein